MADKLPAFQFYPGDWRKDLAVQSLDYESRGVWHELLCFMHESEERGRLVFPDGSPMDDEAIAQMVGIPEAKWKQIRSKLVSRKVAGEDEDGTLYNRRMCREEAIRQAKRDAGRKGGKSKANAKQTPSKRQANRGSSSSSSSSNYPLPQQAGESLGDKKLNPRAAGTNPRAVAAREKEAERIEQEITREVDEAWHDLEVELARTPGTPEYEKAQEVLRQFRYEGKKSHPSDDEVVL